jgi:hypothetical protein
LANNFSKGSQTISNREAFRDPDFQYVIGRAQHAFARSGEPDLASTLVDMIAERSMHTQRSRLALSLNAGIEVASELTANEFAELTLVFLLRYSHVTAFEDLSGFTAWVDRAVVPFLDLIETGMSSYQYLQAKGCATIEVGSIRLEKLLARNYGGLFQKGFKMHDVESSLPSADMKQIAPHLMKCMHDNAAYQFKYLNSTLLRTELQTHGVPEEVINNLVNLAESRTWGHDELKSNLAESVPQIDSLFSLWNDKPQLARLSLTSTGIAIGFCNAKRLVPKWEADLASWIS